MRREREYRERCATRGLSLEAIDQSVSDLLALEAELGGEGSDLDAAPLEAVEARLARLVAEGACPEARITAIARYFLVAGVNDAAIRLLSYLLPIGVLPSMADRLLAIEGKEIRDRVMAGVEVPPPGSPPEAYPPPTAVFVRALERELGPVSARRVLTCNVHGVPASSFAAEREAFLAAPSAEAWAAGYHARQVAVLERHVASGELWFEQRITRRVVDFVRDSPEILGAVREGEFLMTTKIPYDPDRYLSSKDPVERRRLACHCPLAASSITAGGAGVPASWCACSAGYEKALFDAVFGQETEVRMVESVLGGSDRCRFAVSLPIL